MLTTSTALETAFDVTNEESSPGWDLLPAAKYKGEICTATTGPTKNGKGVSVNLAFVITEGQYEKRMLFWNILIEHDSVEARRIGRGNFKDVCVSCGITEPLTDLGKLLYKPLAIYVKISKDKGGEYPDKNEVYRVTPWSGDRPVVRKDGNGSTANLVKEASTTPKAFEAVDADLNDDIPWR